MYLANGQTAHYTSNRGRHFVVRNIGGKLSCTSDGKKVVLTKEIENYFTTEKPAYNDYSIYIDAAYDPKTSEKNGSYGALIREKRGQTSRIRGTMSRTTYSRLCLMAAIKALEELPVETSVKLFSRSKYVAYTIRGYFKRLTNVDLWERFDEAANRKKIEAYYLEPPKSEEEFKECVEISKNPDLIKTKREQSEEIIAAANKANKAFETEKGSNPHWRMVTNSFRNDYLDISLCGKPIEITNDSEANANTVGELSYTRKIKSVSARSIIAFWNSSRTFDDFASLRTGGCDKFSNMSLEKLIKECGGPVVIDKIRPYAPPQYDVKILRWHMRGLSLADSIRKVLVDDQVYR